MTIDFKGLDIYFHMTNHYKKLRKVKSLIDCSLPKGYGEIDSNQSRLSYDKSNSRSSSVNYRSPKRNVPHLPTHSNGLKRHDCSGIHGKTPRLYNANEEKGRPSSVPLRAGSTPQDKSGRPKSVEPLVRKVPFSRFNPPQPPTSSGNAGDNNKKKKSKTSQPANSGRNSSLNNSRGSRAKNSSDAGTDSDNSSAAVSSIRRKSVKKKVTSVGEHEYLHFLLRITEDILRNDLYTNKEMQKVFDSHMKANENRLDKDKMEENINSLKKELNYPGAHARLDSGFCACDRGGRKNLIEALMKCGCRPNDTDTSQNCSKCDTDVNPTETQVEIEIAAQHYGSINDNSSSDGVVDDKSEKSSGNSDTRKALPPKTEIPKLQHPKSYLPQEVGDKVFTCPSRARPLTGRRPLPTPKLTEEAIEVEDKNDSPEISGSIRAKSHENPDIEMLYNAKQTDKTKNPLAVSAGIESGKALHKKCAHHDDAKNRPVVQDMGKVSNVEKHHLSEKAPDIIFHTNKGEECHCKISFRKLALKLQNDDNTCDTYVLVDGPVCIPKSMLEERCIPVLLEASSSSTFDHNDTNQADHSKNDSIANFLRNIDSRDERLDCVDEKSFSKVDVSSSLSIDSKLSYSQDDACHSKHEKRKKSITIAPTASDGASKPKQSASPAESANGNDLSLESAIASAQRQKKDFKTDLLLNGDYDLTPQRDVSVFDYNEGNGKYHFLMVDKTTSMTIPEKGAMEIRVPRLAGFTLAAAPAAKTQAAAVTTIAPARKAILTEVSTAVTEASAIMTKAPAPLTEAPAAMTEPPAPLTQAPAAMTEVSEAETAKDTAPVTHAVEMLESEPLDEDRHNIIFKRGSSDSSNNQLSVLNEEFILLPLSREQSIIEDVPDDPVAAHSLSINKPVITDKDPSESVHPAESSTSLIEFLKVVKNEDEVEIKSLTMDSLKHSPTPTSNTFAIHSFSSPQQRLSLTEGVDGGSQSDEKDRRSVITGDTEVFQTGTTPLTPIVHKSRSPNALQRDQFIFQQHPSEETLTRQDSPLFVGEASDYLNRLDRENSMTMTRDHTRQVEEITGKLKRFRHAADEVDNVSVRHQYQSNVANRMSLVSTNTGISQISADKIAKFNPNTSDPNLNSKCCGLLKNKNKRRTSLSSSTSDVSASYPKNYR